MHVMASPILTFEKDPGILSLGFHRSSLSGCCIILITCYYTRSQNDKSIKE